jgi:phospholipase/lecithinase/hemolysin
MKLRTLILTLAAVSWAAAAHATLFDEIFVFGDSLSDAGNAYDLTAGFPPYVYPPPTPTKRATNGPTAVEVMAGQLGTPLTASQGGGTNYAVMGAATQAYTRTDLPDSPFGALPVKPASVTTHNYVPYGYWYLDNSRIGAAGYGIDTLKPYGVDKQVADFRAAPPAHDPARSLFVLWTGANDFLLGGPTGFLGAASSIASFVGQLYDDPAVGARYFLVPNIPDLSKTPDSLAALPPDQAALLRLVTASFNQTLSQNLAALDDTRPGLTIVQFDTFGFLDAVLANPSLYGFANTTQPCVDRADPELACGNPDEHVFWDGFHPSAASHALIGEAFAGAITQAIPEPETYVLMAAGLIVLAVARRRAAG